MKDLPSCLPLWRIGLAGFVLYCILLPAACVPPQPVEYGDIDVNVEDTVFQKIADLQDRQEIDALYTYLRHPNPTYRYLAARAFGSIREPATVDTVALLLADEQVEVRAMAAFALGQTGASAAEPLLIRAFDQQDTAGVYREANRAILEAVGKTGTVESLRALAQVTSYLPTDTMLLAGQAWAIYRFALRDITDPIGTERMMDVATTTTYPDEVRFIAANYLQRAKISIDSSETRLPTAFRQATDARVRMALAIATGKMQSEAAAQALIQQYGQETDWRVKTNILRAFGNFPYAAVRETALTALSDPNIQVALRAAQHFLENGIPEEATLYWRKAKEITEWPVQLQLYAAAQRHLPLYMADTRNIINYELRQRIQQAVSPYEKVAALRAFAEFNWNFRNIWEMTAQSPDAVVRTAGIEGIAQISEADNFESFFGLGSRRVRKELSIYFQRAIASGDVGQMAVAAGALRSTDRKYSEVLDSLDFLETAMGKLVLPESIETYNELQQTLDILRKTEVRPPQKVAYNHPIDWSVLKGASQQLRADITTPRGLIVIELWPERAPGTVINLIRLANDKFFDGKVFHRVVPNFVVQGGCPRGDGYGSLDYSIRSELTPVHYDVAGIIGMASAGNHTEGTQFFITHSPTPHLDGNYTAFGKVVRGQDIVDQMRVGDTITSLRIE